MTSAVGPSATAAAPNRPSSAPPDTSPSAHATPSVAPAAVNVNVSNPGCSHRAATDESTFASAPATPHQTHVKPGKNPAPSTSKTAFSPAEAVEPPPPKSPTPPRSPETTGDGLNSISTDPTASTDDPCDPTTTRAETNPGGASGTGQSTA